MKYVISFLEWTHQRLPVPTKLPLMFLNLVQVNWLLFILTYLICVLELNLSLYQYTICIIPVPKTSTVSCMNDLRPVALTSVAMMICERFVLNLQFAYSKHRTEDAILFSMDKLYSHLEYSKFSRVSARIYFLTSHLLLTLFSRIF